MIIDSKEKSAELLPNYDMVVGHHPSVMRTPPPTPVIYHFTGWAQNSMLLMPPPAPAAAGVGVGVGAGVGVQQQQQQQPLYRISVELDLNPFLPVSYVTRIFRCVRGGSGGAETDLVGEFALSLNNKRAVVSLGDIATRLANALYSVNSNPRHFNWVLGNRLHWDCRETLENGSPMCICYLPPSSTSRSTSRSSHSHSHALNSAGESIQLATFVPPPPDRSPPLPDATLTVFPYGHRLMDEIVVSALVVERMLNR